MNKSYFFFRGTKIARRSGDIRRLFTIFLKHSSFFTGKMTPRSPLLPPMSDDDNFLILTTLSMVFKGFLFSFLSDFLWIVAMGNDEKCVNIKKLCKQIIYIIMGRKFWVQNSLARNKKKSRESWKNFYLIYSSARLQPGTEREANGSKIM